MKPRWAKVVVAAPLVLLYGFLLVRAQARLEEHRGRAQVRVPDISFGMPRSVLVPMSLRFREAIADLYWIRALIYFGTRSDQKRAPTLIADMFDDLLTLDPYFKRAYKSAAFLTRHRPMPVERSVPESVAYLDRGFEKFPDEWEFAFYAGAAYLVDMPAADDAARLRNRRVAADYIRRAAALGAGKGAPDWLPALAATVLTEVGEKEVALRQLQDALLAAPDEHTRQQIRGKIASLQGAVEAERANQAVRTFLARWTGNYPYVTLDMFLLLGQRLDGTVLSLSEQADVAVSALAEPDEETTNELSPETPLETPLETEDRNVQ